MTLNRKTEIFKEFVKLLENGQTGNATQLAKRINISRSKLYELIDEVKTLGIDIKYSRKFNSFQYSNHLRLKINIPVEVISDHEYETINGGQVFIHKYFNIS